jgi:hypothetical protein
MAGYASAAHKRTIPVVVAIEEVDAVLYETERPLRVIPKDDPGRDALEASLSDLRVLHRWLSTTTTAESAARLSASRDTIERAR